MMSFVLDSLPIIVLLLQQPGWERVDQILTEASDEGRTLPISSVNLGEVYYVVARGIGENRAREIVMRMLQPPYEVVTPTVQMTLHAAELKIGGGLSYADCFAAALALERGIPVLTNDREFERLTARGLKVERLT